MIRTSGTYLDTKISTAQRGKSRDAVIGRRCFFLRVSTVMVLRWIRPLYITSTAVPQRLNSRDCSVRPRALMHQQSHERKYKWTSETGGWRCLLCSRGTGSKVAQQSSRSHRQDDGGAFVGKAKRKGAYLAIFRI